MRGEQHAAIVDRCDFLQCVCNRDLPFRMKRDFRLIQQNDPASRQLTGEQDVAEHHDEVLLT